MEEKQVLSFVMDWTLQNRHLGTVQLETADICQKSSFLSGLRKIMFNMKPIVF
jgi:hypothetical protein